MTGTPNKRQKRNDYRANLQASTNGTPLEAPKKKFYRQRAHANPFSDHSLTYPTSPSAMDWSVHFPAFVKKPLDPSTITTPLPSSPSPPKLSHPVEIADIGCGFGGLLVALSPLFPRTPMIGMELRTQVTDYVIDRVQALRSQNQSVSSSAAAEVASPAAAGSEITPGPYQNVSALRANTMKFLPNFFGRGQLAKVFLCFPDPHFKARKHKARIVSAQLNAEYAFVLRPGGRVYTITDVEELHGWIVRHFEGVEGGAGRELWERVEEEELGADPCVRVMSEETEEGKKVSRNGGRKFVGVWTRRGDPAWPE